MDSLPDFDALLAALPDHQTKEAADLAAWLAQCEAAAGDIRAQAARWWQTAQHARARFRTCQFIEGEASPRDDCKCGAPTQGGAVYCQEHAAQCYAPPKKEPKEFEIRPLHARAA